MTPKLQVPSESVKYILYQRTNYLRFSNSYVYKSARRILPNASYKLLIAIESRLYKDQIINRYAESMKFEYSNIKEYLPQDCNAVLDIGCGVAGIDPFFSWHYQNPLQFYLLDKSFTDKEVKYEYREKASFYNSLLVARELLALNGIDQNHVHLIEADNEYSIPISQQIGLVISLLAWGFHFPVGTYLGKVFSLLTDGGIIIMDISKESDGIAELRGKFQSVAIIREKKDHFRVVARKT